MRNVALVAEDSPSLSPGLSMTIVSVDTPASVSASNITAYGYVLQKDDAYQLAYFDGQFNAAVNTTAAGSWGWHDGGVAAFAQAQCNTFMHNDDQWTFRRDGTLIANVSPGNGQNGAISDNFEPVYIGARIDGGNTSFGYNGLTSEILMVTAALDAAQIADAERYMLEKWGL